MKKICFCFLVTISFFIASCSSANKLYSELHHNENSSSTVFTEVDGLIQKAIIDSAFPGAVLLAAKDGEILHEKAYGNYTYDPTSPKVELYIHF